MSKKANILINFGERLREIRISRNLSQEQLGELASLHRTYIGMIERGERNISLSNMAVFAKVFEINISELLDLKSININHNYKDYEIKSEK